MTLKNKIIEVAYELFSSKGYKQTTIADIIKASGSSKGGFYHHFKSKEDIINSTFDNYVEDLKTYYDNLFDYYNNDIIKVFNGVFHAINIYQSEHMIKWPYLMKLLTYEDNSLVIIKMTRAFEQITETFYCDLINKGTQEGLWSIDMPSNVAGLWTRELLRLYTLISKLIDDYKEKDYTQFVSLLDFNEQLINHLLSTDQIRIKEDIMNYYVSAKSQGDQMNINSYETS